jgi:hypothetical protein
MFIHFDSDEGTKCDNCGSSPTLMHVSMEHSARAVNLCIALRWGIDADHEPRFPKTQRLVRVEQRNERSRSAFWHATGDSEVPRLALLSVRVEDGASAQKQKRELVEAAIAGVCP